MRKVRIKQWGNSKAVRIPVEVLESLNLKGNDWLEIGVDEKNKQIVLKVDDGLTPYQRLMARTPSATVRNQVIWDRTEEELADFPIYKTK